MTADYPDLLDNKSLLCPRCMTKTRKLKNPDGWHRSMREKGWGAICNRCKNSSTGPMPANMGKYPSPRGRPPAPEGTRKKNKHGYMLIKRGGLFLLEHRVIMEEMLGRELIPKVESVHHINGIRDENRPENLELWVGGIRYGQRAHQIECPHCSRPYYDNEH